MAEHVAPFVEQEDLGFWCRFTIERQCEYPIYDVRGEVVNGEQERVGVLLGYLYIADMVFDETFIEAATAHEGPVDLYVRGVN